MTLNIVFRNTGLFLLLIFLQLFLFENISLTRFEIIPNFYILFILILFIEIPGWALLLSAFFLGLIIDISYDTGGVNAASSVLVAFLRPTVLKLLTPRDGYPSGTSPSISEYGFVWFLKYGFILIFIHNLAYYLFVKLSFEDFFITISKTLLSTILVLILIILSQYLFKKNN